MDELREATRDFLTRALAATGWTPYRLSKEAGVSATTITRPLNKPDWKFVPKLDTLSKIAKVSGVDLPDILKTTVSMDIVSVRGSIPVWGSVRAGSWEQIPDEPVIEEWLQMDVPEYAGASLFALRVTGRSMDLVYADGSFVILAPPSETGLRIGDRVVVRQYDASGKAETTLKEITKGTSETIVLQPRSSDPAHQTPLIIPIRRDSDVGVEIVGVVVAVYALEARGRGPLLDF